MLKPGDRQYLLEVLRPPAGYQLDRAIGTTFSLDLMTLLTVPLAFTFFNWEDEDGRPVADPLALFESIRRHSGRLSVFCQAGSIILPKRHERLFSYLEDVVVEVKAPREGGIFHPKVWVLRYRADDRPIRYRFLCLSRNLTFDRSWDSILTLEGPLEDRVYAHSVNHPLGDFLEALPDMAVRPCADRIRRDIELLQDEVRGVGFDLPDQFEDHEFHPLGLGRRSKSPFDQRTDRLLIVSPFATDDVVNDLASGCDEAKLVSRPETLHELEKSTLTRLGEIYVMDPAASPEEGDDDEMLRDTDSEEAVSMREDVLYGLHTKLYVADAGWRAHVWTGSANATTAGLRSNVEFMVRLSGKKSRVGIDAFLGDDKNPGFGMFLMPYAVSGDEKSNLVEKRLERLLRTLRVAIAASNLSVHVVATGDDQYELRLAPDDELEIPENVSVDCWPVMLPEHRKQGLDGREIVFRRLSLEAISPFFGFKVEASDADTSVQQTFVAKLPLFGDPTQRKKDVLQSLLNDQHDVLRLLRLLLSELSEGGSMDVGVLQGVAQGSQKGSSSFELPLFETLLKALGRSPEKLKHVAELIKELESTEAGSKLLPDGLEKIWRPI